MTSVSPIAITPTGPVRTAARLFRFDGRLHVAGIAKVRLLIVPDGPMRAADPRTIETKDKLDAGGRCRVAAETAVFVPGADVTFSGNIGKSRTRRSGGSTTVRLALVRPTEIGGPLAGGQALVDKTREVHSAYEPIGFGPLAAIAPERQRLFPGDLLNDEGEIPELRSGMDFSFFHAAPADQRASYMRGDEWLYLEHLHPTLERVASRLPNLAAVGTVRLPNGMASPFTMRIDTLAIDGENAWCDVLARGSFAIGSERDVGALSLVLGFELVSRAKDDSPRMRQASALAPPVAPPAPAPPRQPPWQAAPPAPTAWAAPAQQAKRDGTMVLEPAAPPRRGGTMILEPPPPTRAGFDGTVIMDQPPRHNSTMLLEPGPSRPAHVEAAGDAGPVSVMPSSFDHRRAEDPPRTTRAPFQMTQARGPSKSRPEIAGAPWAHAPAKKVAPVVDPSLQTLGPDGESLTGEVAAAAESAMDAFKARARREAEAAGARALAETTPPKSRPK